MKNVPGLTTGRIFVNLRRLVYRSTKRPCDYFAVVFVTRNVSSRRAAPIINVLRLYTSSVPEFPFSYAARAPRRDIYVLSVFSDGEFALNPFRSRTAVAVAKSRRTSEHLVYTRPTEFVRRVLDKGPALGDPGA